MAKGDGREVGDRERTGSSCVFISCSWYTREHPRPQAQARAALTVALGQAVEQLIVIGSFALKECCGWEGNAG